MEELLTNIASILALVGGIAVVLRKTVLELGKVLNGEVELPDQMPDLSEWDAKYLPDNPVGKEMPDLSEEDLSAILGSEELQMKNKLFDEKIELLRKEISARPGELYEEDHNVINSQYIPKPTHEYAE